MGVPGPRRKAREAALQVLFAADASDQIDPVSIEEVYNSVLEEFLLSPRVRERTAELTQGVACNLKVVDERIGQACTHWKLNRMATVDRNILRIAAYELLFEPATPVEVVLDEAVEIARRFASESSTAFVNGVLDVIASECRRGQR